MTTTWPDAAALEAWRVVDDTVAVAAAHEAIVGYCRWHICPILEDDVLVLDGSGLSVQMLPTMKLLDVSSVTEQAAWCGTITPDPVTLVDGADFTWSERGILTRTGWGRVWTTRDRGVVATITHGIESLTEDLVAVALSIAARSTASPSGDSREARGPFLVNHAVGAGAEALGFGLTTAEKAVLNRYRIIS